MKQIEIVKYSKIPTDEEFIRWSDDAAALVHKYNWEDKKVWPWSFPMSVVSIIDQVRTAPICTYSSKVECYLLAKGLTDILNAWEKIELEGITLKNLKTGKTFKIEKDFADEMMKDMPGKYEVIE